ncbi:restriction endonuclease subunit S, partial [Enterococcus mundtii]|uniref:restriction endonuclease subunit S n=1 Tax=Enterococcus mundtii TaxID=53346 RepID=UPI00209BB5CC
VRFAGFTEEWEQRKLGDMGKTFTGLNGKSKEDFGHGNAKFVTYVNVFANTIANPKMVERVEVDAKQNQVKYGDVFFTTSSETPEEVGMSAVWLEDSENVYLNSFCFGYRPFVDINSYYLAIMLRSPLIRKNFMLLAQGISRYNISKTKVMEMDVPIPNLKEQQKIGAFFKHLDNTITLHQNKISQLKKLKKALLQSMFI